MKKLGHETLFLPTGVRNPRNGESTFTRLTDGRILFAYTQYTDTDWEDHAEARICGCYSSDEGESWTAPTVLIEKAPEAQNIMSPSIFLMQNGQLGIVYLRKDVNEEGYVTCMPVFSVSNDNGHTWSKAVYCTDELGYYCVINDGCMIDRSGRIWVPMSHHGQSYDAFGRGGHESTKYHGGTIRFTFSDDNGKTWAPMPAVIRSPYEDAVGLAEPGIYEYEDGKLWMYCRTAYGFQYQSFSIDRGETWSAPAPNFCFTSPDSPMRIKRVGPYTAAVFNPIPFSCMYRAAEAWGSPKRTPLICTISHDDGHSFDTTGKTPVSGHLRAFQDTCYFLEDDQTESYCYPSIFETSDGFLVSYYHSNGTLICLNSSRITKVYFSEIES